MAFQKGHKPMGGQLRVKKKKTIQKEMALEQLKQGILKELKPILRGALDSARGLTVMYQKKKVKTKEGFKRIGELVQVKDQARVEELLQGSCSGDDWYYITTKDPNIQAIKELWDRSFGKVKESLELTGNEGGPIELGVVLKNKIDKIYGNSGNG
jgi:hypothetical protein